MKPSLLILAAGAGSRFGGLKQLEPLGPFGETILEYSIYDALKAGFGKVVLIIREEFLNDFEGRFSRYGNQIELEYSFQEVNPQFENVKSIAGRDKPWGTVHAVLSASKIVDEPFAVINADDFYGKEAFQLMADFLKNRCCENHWSMIGYSLQNTLSVYGGVSRGVCETDGHGLLKKVKECRGIQRKNGDVFYREGDREVLLNEHTAVSMNFWGFHPQFFELAEKHFRKFVNENAENPKSEMTLPDLVQPLIENGIIGVAILKTHEKWFGITYQEDKSSVASKLTSLVKAGLYPEKLRS